MILDATQFRQLVAEVSMTIAADSTGVGEIEIVDSLAGITSLPALKIVYGRETVVEAPLSLLSKRADDAAQEAQEAITAAEVASVLASAAADRADAERVNLEEIKHLTQLATSEALTQTNVSKGETRLTGETRLATLATLTDLQRKLVDVVIVIADAHTGVEELAEYQKRADEVLFIVARNTEELLTISEELKTLRAQVAEVTRQAFVAISACNLSTDDARLFASLAQQAAEVANIAGAGADVAGEYARHQAFDAEVAAKEARDTSVELQKSIVASDSIAAVAKENALLANDATKGAELEVEESALLRQELTHIAEQAEQASNHAIDSAAGAAAAAAHAKEQAEAAKVATEATKGATINANQKAELAFEKAGVAESAAQSAINAASEIESKIQSGLDKLIASAPDALDTLQELSAALGDDPNFATTIAAELGKKLNRTDIVNDLTTGGVDRPISAEQVKMFKANFDTHNHDDLYEGIINRLTAFNKDFGNTAETICEGNDSRLSNARPPLTHKHTISEICNFPTSMPASDVPGWAKAPNKPSYTAAEVGAALASHGHSAGEVSEDVNRRFVSDSEKSNWNSKAAGSHNHDAVYQPKGSYQPAGSYAPSSHGHSAGEVSEDGSRRFVTDGEKNEWNSKASGSHNHGNVYQPAGSYAEALHGHSANQVSEETNRRWMTEAERIALSSLGTYAKADFSNITSKSMGQNGYYKLPDGLLIQWGYSGDVGSSQESRMVIFPISFYNSSYSITATMDTTSSQIHLILAMVVYKSTSYVSLKCRYEKNSYNDAANEGFHWLAIGRWK